MELRRAEPSDAIAVARVHVRSWQAAYRKLMPDDYLDQLRPEDRAKKYDFGNLDPLRPYTIIATESGRILGFATTAQTQESPMSVYGELSALYVDPDHWGRGIGVALVSAARSRLFDLGFRNAILWVLEGNVRAERFYVMDHWGAANGRGMGREGRRSSLQAQARGTGTWIWNIDVEKPLPSMVAKTLDCSAVDSAVAPDYERTRFPDSSATST